jgi:hypothetical protein
MQPIRRLSSDFFGPSTLSRQSAFLVAGGFPMLTFHVRSKSTPGLFYSVRSERKNEKLIVTCDCDAARNGQWCGHRIGLLASQTPLSLEHAELLSWFRASSLPAVLDEIARLEESQARIKAELSSAKKHLARVLIGGD